MDQPPSIIAPLDRRGRISPKFLPEFMVRKSLGIDVQRSSRGGTDSGYGRLDCHVEDVVRPLTLPPELLRRVDSLRELDDAALEEFARLAVGTSRTPRGLAVASRGIFAWAHDQCGPA